MSADAVGGPGGRGRRVPTLDAVLRGAWDEHAPRSPADRRAWCHPVYPSHVRRTIVRAVVASAGEPWPGPRRVDPARADRIRELLAQGGWDRVVELGAIARTLAGETRDALIAQKAPLSMRDVSEWAAGTVARLYSEHAAVPGHARLEQAREDFLVARAGTAARARQAARLSDAELTERCAAHYERLWAEHGPQTLRTCSPPDLGLGSLPRPPWSGPEGNWRTGTDRSVLSRYHRYFYPKAWVRDPASVAAAARMPAEQHVSVRLLSAGPLEIAGSELRRACAPIGLRFAEHHCLVASVVQGIRDADLMHAYASRRWRPDTPLRPAEHRPTLRQWADDQRGLAAGPDPGLAAAFASYAEHWCRRNDTAERFVESQLRANGPDWFVQVELGVARRLWHIAHGREIEWERPFTRAELPRVLRGILQRHLLELVERPVARPEGTPPADPGHRAREQNTLRALHRQGPVAIRALTELVTSGDQQWLPRYAAIVAGPAPCLTPEEFRRWLAGHLGHGDDTGEAWT